MALSSCCAPWVAFRVRRSPSTGRWSDTTYPASRSSTNSTAWPLTPTGCLVTSGKLMYYRVFREGLTGSPPRLGPHVSNCTSTLSCLSLDPQIGSTDWVLKLGSLMPQVHRHVYHRVLRLGPQTRSLYASGTLSCLLLGLWIWSSYMSGNLWVTRSSDLILKYPRYSGLFTHWSSDWVCRLVVSQSCRLLTKDVQISSYLILFINMVHASTADKLTNEFVVLFVTVSHWHPLCV